MGRKLPFCVGWTSTHILRKPFAKCPACLQDKLIWTLLTILMQTKPGSANHTNRYQPRCPFFLCVPQAPLASWELFQLTIDTENTDLTKYIAANSGAGSVSRSLSLWLLCCMITRALGRAENMLSQIWLLWFLGQRLV